MIVGIVAVLSGCGGGRSADEQVTVNPIKNGAGVRDVLLEVAQARVEGDPAKTHDFGIGGA